MAHGINKVTIVGYMGAEPELTMTSQNTPICNIRIATTESWKGATGQVKRTEWHHIVCFRRIAEVAARFLHKGSLVYVEGRLSTRKVVAQNVTYFTTEIIATELQVLSSPLQPAHGYQASQSRSYDRKGKTGLSNYDRNAVGPDELLDAFSTGSIDDDLMDGFDSFDNNSALPF